MEMALEILRSDRQDELLRRCRKGDAKAQRDLYESLSGKMLGICTRYLHDPMEAEDVMVTGFMKVFEKLSQFKGEGSFEGWARRIMVNEALTVIRRRKMMHVGQDISEVRDVALTEAAPTELEEAELLQMVQDLPTGFRTVFNLYAIEGYSHREIAVMLEISESTSKSQLHRARAALQQKVVYRDSKSTNSIRRS